MPFLVSSFAIVNFDAKKFFKGFKGWNWHFSFCIFCSFEVTYDNAGDEDNEEIDKILLPSVRDVRPGGQQWSASDWLTFAEQWGYKLHPVQNVFLLLIYNVITQLIIQNLQSKS